MFKTPATSLLKFFGLVGIVGTLVACEGGGGDLTVDRETYEDAIANNQYKSWKQFPDASPDLYASAQHNGDFVRSYMNDIAFNAIAGFDERFPDGSIIIKEQYGDAEGTMLTGHTVMVKVEGYDSERNDWYWIAYDGNGETTQFNGMANYCYGCHASAKDTNDWLLTAFR